MATARPLRTSKSLDKLSIFRHFGSGNSKKRDSQAEIKQHESILQNTQFEQSALKSLSASCCICDSSLRYPAGAICFRCTVCDTINDLKTAANDAMKPFEVKEVEDLTERLSCPDPVSMIDYEQISRRISVVFSSARCLNESFPSGRALSHIESGVDLAAVRRMYRVFSRHQPLMQMVIQTTSALLDRPGKKIKQAQDARFLLILLENPHLSFRKHKCEGLAAQHLLQKIVGLISSLPNDLHQFMVNWLGRYSKDIFLQRIDLVNSFLSHRLGKLDRNPTRNYYTCWQVKAASRMMALLFSANTIKVRVPVSRFYNSYADYIDLDSDFIAWKNRQSRYSFCQYPCLISLKQKQRILAVDACRQMQLKQREAFLNSLDGKMDEPVFNLTVRRDRLLQDSLAIIPQKESELKKKLIVTFEDEYGVDAGGLRKEYFLLLCRQLFDPKFGLFQQDEDSHYCWFNPFANEQKFVSMYHLLGVILGLAIYNSVILDVNLPPALFKKLVGQPCGLQDLEILHPSMSRGLKQLLEYTGDVESTFCRSFVVEEHNNGVSSQIPLCRNGEHMSVTNQNRKLFVEGYVRYIFEDSCSKSFFHISRGFHQVAGGNALSLLRAEEIELLVRGSPEPLNLDDLKSICTYEGYPAAQSDPMSEPVVRNFWTLFENMTSMRQRTLLLFVTGSDRVPATGTIDLQFRITVDCSASLDRLPVAHTCFSQLVLPRYDTLELLDGKLRNSLQEGATGFSIA